MIAGTPKYDERHILSIIDYKKQEITPLEYWPEDGIDAPDIAKSSVYTDYSELYSNGNGRFLYKTDRNRYGKEQSLQKVNRFCEENREFETISLSDDFRQNLSKDKNQKQQAKFHQSGD